MKIVLFGEDIFSAAVLQSLLNGAYQVQLVICPDYENDQNYKTLKNVAGKYHIPFMRVPNVNSMEVRETIVRLSADLIVSVHLKKVLKPEIFNIPKLGAINIHPSLLPKYRGLSPHHQVLIHGESLSGVCIHYIEEGIDTGDIIALEKFEISSNDYIANVQFKMLDIYKRLIIKAISNIEDENFIPTPQQQSNASYFGKLKKTDFEIDVHKSKEEIYNLIRAVSLPYSGAVLDKYKVWSARVPDHQEEERLLKKFKEERFLKDSAQDLLIIRANNGLLISDDFEIINI